MEVTDTVVNIAQQIDDPKTLVKYCNLNKKSRDICSTKHFWKIIFNKWEIDYPEIEPTNVDEWLFEFLCRYNVNKILDLLYNSSTHFILFSEDHIINKNPLNYAILLTELQFEPDIALQDVTNNIFYIQISYHTKGDLIGWFNIYIKLFKEGTDIDDYIIYGNCILLHVMFLLNKQQIITFLYNIFKNHLIKI